MSLTVTDKLAERLKDLRTERDWSLDQLAARSGVSRASLSRLENAEVSPTTDVLGKLCSAFGLSLSRLMAMVEDGFEAVVRRNDQALWADEGAQFARRVVSPPAGELAAEVIECILGPGAHLSYAAPAVPGQEHHLILQRGKLEITVEDVAHTLHPGDCLRYRLHGATDFRNPGARPAKYTLVLV